MSSFRFDTRRFLPGMASLVLFVFCAADCARADLVFTLSEAVDGGVTVTATGSGTVTANHAWNTIPLADFDTDFLEIGGGVVFADSASGTLTNLDTAATYNVTNLFFADDDGGSNIADDAVAELDLFYTFNPGHEFEFSLTATFDVGTLAFSDLVVGSHNAPDDTVNEIFGQQTLIVTPEPASLAMMGLAMTSFVAMGWRRRRSGQRNRQAS